MLQIICVMHVRLHSTHMKASRAQEALEVAQENYGDLNWTACCVTRHEDCFETKCSMLVSILRLFGLRVMRILVQDVVGVLT